MNLKAGWSRFRDLCEAIGVRDTIEFAIYRHYGHMLGGRREHWIRPKKTDHPLCVRFDTSDICVFNQIFLKREYSCLSDLRDVSLIIDCGANVGYSSAWFLSRFPHSRVVAVEPDPANFQMLERNLTPYGNRVRLICAGVWSHTAPLVIRQEKYRDGGEWARQVRLAAPDEKADVTGVDIEALLAKTGSSRVSILKIDIEGAEAVVFSKGYEKWLPQVDAIAIELHDDSAFGNASQIFSAAVAGQGFRISRIGDLTICRRADT